MINVGSNSLSRARAELLRVPTGEHILAAARTFPPRPCGRCSMRSSTAWCRPAVGTQRVVAPRWRRRSSVRLTRKRVRVFGPAIEVKAELYWAARKAIRRYRASKGKFGTRMRFKSNRFKKRFRRKGPLRLHGQSEPTPNPSQWP